MVPASKYLGMVQAADKADAWDETEDITLITTLVKIGNKPWKEIAAGMKTGRTGSQVRDRFHKTIKKSAKYKGMLPESALKHRRNPGPVVAVPPSPTTMTEADLLAVEVPIDFDDDYGSQDRFSFEDIWAMGAMPHLAQPVPLSAIPSPASLAALPVGTFREPWVEPPQPAPSPPKPVAASVTFREVPKLNQKFERGDNGWCATQLVHLPQNGWAEDNFKQINAMLAKPLPKQKRKPREAAPSKSALVFNAAFVRPIGCA